MLWHRKNNPTKFVFQIYRDVGTNMGSKLSSDEKDAFLDYIPELHKIKHHKLEYTR